MAKIICAFPGTSSGALYILLRYREKDQAIVYDYSGTVGNLERMVKNTDVLILKADIVVIEKLNSLGVEFDLVYPDPVISPSRFTNILAMEGMRLKEIHDLVHSWRDQLSVLQRFTQSNVTHIVLAEGQSIVDTHGVVEDGQGSRNS
jgi:hypothetical protein